MLKSVVFNSEGSHSERKFLRGVKGCRDVRLQWSTLEQLREPRPISWTLCLIIFSLSSHLFTHKGVYTCSAHGAWTNEVLKRSLPTCLPGTSSAEFSVSWFPTPGLWMWSWEGNALVLRWCHQKVKGQKSLAPPLFKPTGVRIQSTLKSLRSLCCSTPILSH